MSMLKSVRYIVRHKDHTLDESITYYYPAIGIPGFRRPKDALKDAVDFLQTEESKLRVVKVILEDWYDEEGQDYTL